MSLTTLHTKKPSGDATGLKQAVHNHYALSRRALVPTILESPQKGQRKAPKPSKAPLERHREVPMGLFGLHPESADRRVTEKCRGQRPGGRVANACRLVGLRILRAKPETASSRPSGSRQGAEPHAAKPIRHL